MTHKQHGNGSSVSPALMHGLAGTPFFFLFFVLFFFFSFSLNAKQWQVSPGNGTLQNAIDSAQAGDTLQLISGKYFGSIIINKRLTLLGVGTNINSGAGSSKGSIVDGENSSHVITVSAPDVIIKGLNIQHSGSVLEDEDSGIFITDKGDRTLIEANFLEFNQIGVYLKGPDDAVVSNNTIIGSQYFRINDRGNGIYLWNSPGSVIKNNTMRYGRDGIFVNGSRNNTFIGNHMSELRFAIHYMYAHDSEVSNNISRNNHVGFALMFSDRITVKNNLSSGDDKRGLFFNFANYSVIEGNRVVGAEKCVFIYNANFNQINNNSFENCQIGIHFTAGSEKNEIYGNAFINNRTQVKYVGTRSIEWSKNGRGNFWSDNVAFDINDDGIADQIYQPNDLVDQIVWRHPLAKLLLNSPSVQILKWAQSEFPGLHPGGVTDSHPIMQPLSSSLTRRTTVSSLIK